MFNAHPFLAVCEPVYNFGGSKRNHQRKESFIVGTDLKRGGGGEI